MDNVALKITSQLLPLVKKKYNGNYSDIASVKMFWHKLIFLTISKVNCLYLNKRKQYTLSDFVSWEILPSNVLQFEIDNSDIFRDCVDKIAKEIFLSTLNLSILREYILGIELYISKNEIKIEVGKHSRDTIGSYYTPYRLAKAVVDKTFSKEQARILICEKKETLKIADLSCGGGEFFSAAQEYLNEKFGIPYETSALYFWGMDVDPIALQITICRLFQVANESDWKLIASHFRIGNPLVSTDCEGNFDSKNMLFALNRIYASEMGINFSLSKNELQFDIILGNPPWEKIRFEERKFFACYEPNIALMSKKNDREQAIDKLRENWKELFNWSYTIYSDYKMMCRKKYSHPLIQKAISGELNTYALFTELAYKVLASNGICSLIVKSTLATAPANKGLWRYFLEQNALSSLYFFDNKNKIFNIDSRERFSIVILSKVKQKFFTFSAGLKKIEDIYICSDTIVNKDDIVSINPFTGMFPNITCTEDFNVLLNVHKRLKLFQEVYPNCHFGRLIHLTAHAKQIDTIQTENNIPIYEGKFIEQYDARYATFAGVSDIKKYAAKATAKKNIAIDGRKPIPESRFFVQKELWDKYAVQYRQPYSLCWRSLTSPTNSRTTIAMILPTCPTCQSIQMLQIEDDSDLLMLLSLFNSLPFDYFVRLKMPGIDLTQSVIKQIPVPSKEIYEQKINFNNRIETLKVHILSCVFYLLKTEPLLNGLLKEIGEVIYSLESNLTSDTVKKMLDELYVQAYQISDNEYDKIKKSFPKY